MMNVPCHAIEKRVKIGNKASSQVLPTDILPAARGYLGGGTWLQGLTHLYFLPAPSYY